jgi:muramidase (phage lysozyme)
MPALGHDEIGANVAAFLDTISVSEGTKNQGDRGYNVIVGSTLAASKLFTSYADHPRVRVWLPHLNEYSTAAGAYQIIVPTWDPIQRKLNLPDFSPESQDHAAIELIHQQNAVHLVVEGYIVQAIQACREIWASFPDAGYGQHEQRMDFLLSAYKQAGGELFTP